MTDGEPRPHPLTGQHFSSPVPPGEGWPDDPASATTPVARTAPQVRRTATATSALEGADGLDAPVSVCRACRRLVRWREEVATTRRASFADQPYWGRPVPGFGDPAARVVVVGLAPAAHGANRTGRNFTGDSSGDWLYASLHRVGLAALPTSTHAGDGQRLHGTRVVAAVRCAPPANKPTPAERDTCAPWLLRELELLAPTMRVVVALGAFGWAAALRALGPPGGRGGPVGRGGPGGLGLAVPSPRPRFGHAAEVTLLPPAAISAESAPVSGLAANTGAGSAEKSGVVLLGSYHPSQHNTFTGRLTPAMLDDVLGRAATLAGLDGTGDAGGGRG